MTRLRLTEAHQGFAVESRDFCPKIRVFLYLLLKILAVLSEVTFPVALLLKWIGVAERTWHSFPWTPDVDVVVIVHPPLIFQLTDVNDLGFFHTLPSHSEANLAISSIK